MKRHIIALCIVVALSLPALMPLLGSGYYPMHDDTQVGRVVTMGNALRSGQFPVRWVNDLGYGYGYPIFNFYGPLPYYVGGSIYALGLDALTATKLMIGLGLILSGVSMYVVSAHLVGIASGIVASVAYMYGPYQAVDIYVRGAIGEVWYMAFLPLIVFGVSRKTATRDLWVLGALGLAGSIVSHTLMGYATVVLLAIGLLYGLIARRRVRPFAAMLLLGLVLAAFFWAPAFVEKGYTAVSGQVSATADYRDHFVCLAQLWSSPWGYAGSAPGCADGMSFMLGKLHIIFGMLGAFLVVIMRGKHHVSIYGSVLIAALGISLFLMLPQAQLVWEYMPNFSFLQYPWRFLSIATFALSGLTGVLIAMVPTRFMKGVAVIGMVVVLISFNSVRFVPQYTYERASDAFESRDDLRFRVSRISDEYLPPEVSRPDDPSEVVRDTIASTETLRIGAVIEKETYKKYELVASEEQDIAIEVAHFPGWVYILDGEHIEPSIDAGRARISLPQGNHVLELRFTNTYIRTIANIISLIGIIWLIHRYGKKTIA